jgi:hypothetical protein
MGMPGALHSGVRRTDETDQTDLTDSGMCVLQGNEG